METEKEMEWEGAGEGESRLDWYGVVKLLASEMNAIKNRNSFTGALFEAFLRQVALGC